MSKKFSIGAAIIGAAAGVIAGVLTAPKSGKETRADIAKKAKELKDKAEDTTEEARVKAAKVAHNMKATAEEYKVRGEKAVEDALHHSKKKE